MDVATIRKKFAQIKTKYLSDQDIPVYGRWKRVNDEDLWKSMIGSIVVVGGTRGWGRLKNCKCHWRLLEYVRLKNEKQSDITRIAKSVFAHHQVRYFSRKAGFVAVNIEIIRKSKGPKGFLSKLFLHKTDAEKALFVDKNLKGFGLKTSRDFLNEIGMTKNVIPFDSRVQEVLSSVGIPKYLLKGLENRKNYERLEQFLLDNICLPLCISGVEFDQMIFRHSEEILGDFCPWKGHI